MNRQVVLELDGNLEKNGLRVSLEIGVEGQRAYIEQRGYLPACPGLATVLRNWQTCYRNLAIQFRLLPKQAIHVGAKTERIQDCQQFADVMQSRLSTWLNSPEFLEVDRQIREELSKDETIQVLIRTQDHRLCHLPWHTWSLIERYPKAEVAFSTSPYKKVSRLQTVSPKAKVRILAIFGDSSGIDIDIDRQVLESLPDAEVKVLLEPSRKEISDWLWEQQWDILFFAGHSETQNNQGYLHINPQESLRLDELKSGLQRKIEEGLQIAIFNSCDGLGLAYQLEQLNIPQMIVMREPIPDRVAQEFAKYFLQAFAQGDPFYLASRKARERLQVFENEFPYASWLPVIFQNPAETPPTWRELCGKTESKSLLDQVINKTNQVFHQVNPGFSKAKQDNRSVSSIKTIETSTSAPDSDLIHPNHVAVSSSASEAELLASDDKNWLSDKTESSSVRRHSQTSEKFEPQQATLLKTPGIGKVEKPITPDTPGKVRFRGTSWTAELYDKNCPVTLSPSDPVQVIATIGITLLVLPEGVSPSSCLESLPPRIIKNNGSWMSKLFSRFNSSQS